MASAHILIVDDDPQIAKSLTEFLKNKTDHVISNAYDGEEAKEKLLEAPSSPQGAVDVVLLDQRMPGLSGLDVLAWLREHPTLCFTRVIMFTAVGGSEDKVEALSAGADDYITKPYFPQELLARVETLLRTQQLERQLQEQSEQLAALNRASNDITTNLEAGQIFSAAAFGAMEVLRAELAAIFLPERPSGRLHCRAAAGAGGRLPIEIYGTIEGGQGIIGTVHADKRLIRVNDVAANDHFSAQTDAPEGVEIANMMAAPMLVRGSSVGVLVAANKREESFSEVDQDLLASLASAVSRGLDNAYLFENVRARQQELQESHNRLQAVINGILNPIYTIDAQWRLVAINRHKAQALEAAPEDLVGQICYEVFFGRQSPCEHCLVAETMSARQPRHWSVRWAGEDHLPQEWDIHAYPLPATQAGAASVVVVWQDRTEERRLENSLLQAGKLAAIGQLAAGVAHEINNPLTAINANAQMLKMVIPPQDDKYEAVELIARAGDRATNVVRGLLDYARQNQYSFDPGDVNQSIHQALRLVSYQLRSSEIEVEKHLNDELPRVRASWEHLKTVWLNLLINARDALQGRSGQRSIEIETRLAPAGDHVQVLFTDNGVGLSSAEAAHIFEPFYTTKEPGQGTGLGLATSQRIVQQHGGDIEVVSRPGQGSTFIVRLPRDREEAESERAESGDQ